jgi:phage head maturation protease
MLITALATTSGVDLENEVIVPAGADVSYFKAARSVYYCHDTFSLPVATLRNLRLEQAGWVIQASTVNTEFARDVATCIADGAINGGSIGFIRTSSGTPTAAEVQMYGPHEYITREWKWLEWSITPFPCNPAAMLLSAVQENTEKAIDKLRTLLGTGKISRKSAEMMGVKRRVIVVKPTITVESW